MKDIFGLLRPKVPAKPMTANSDMDSELFSTAFAGQGVEPSMLVPWETRAQQINARSLPSTHGGKLLQALWAKDKYMALLGAPAMARMERFFEFSSVPANRHVIHQDEYGNFMVVLLSGTIAVDRIQPWGEPMRLAETRPGDILGEMSLLDSGIRFSACTTLTESEIAVLSAQAMDDMLSTDPQLAASLIALLARKLSLRLRVISARLGSHHK